MKTLIYVLIAVNSLLICVSQSQAQVAESSTFSRPFQLITLRAIVQIHDRTDGVRGTGFVIGRDSQERLYVMTCAHVAERGHRLEIDFYPHGSIDAKTNIDLVAFDKARDMAILRLPRGYDVLPIPVCQYDKLPQGNFETLVVGFPNGERTSKITRAVRRSTSDGRENLYLREDLGPGASGSPVILRRGDHDYVVIGVYWGHSSSQGIATVNVHSFLKENSLDFLQHDVTDADVASAVTTALDIILEELSR
jgi:hypothetical protein